MALPRFSPGFGVRLFAIYGLLAVAPWPGLRDGYADAFRAVGDGLFNPYGENGWVRFDRLDDASTIHDTKTSVGIWGKTGGNAITYSARTAGYLPVAAIVALVCATPLPWPRRLRALVWGLILVHVFIALRVWLMVLFAMCGPAGLAMYSPGVGVMKALATVVDIVSISPAASMLVPVFIWLIVCFWRDGWGALFARDAR